MFYNFHDGWDNFMPSGFTEQNCIFPRQSKHKLLEMFFLNKVRQSINK